jgi:hypothetical protein
LDNPVLAEDDAVRAVWMVLPIVGQPIAITDDSAV